MSTSLSTTSSEDRQIKILSNSSSSSATSEDRKKIKKQSTKGSSSKKSSTKVSDKGGSDKPSKVSDKKTSKAKGGSNKESKADSEKKAPKASTKGGSKNESKSTKNKKRRKKKNREVDTLVYFGTDDKQRSHSVEAPEGVVSVIDLSKHFKMTSIKYLISEEHYRVTSENGLFPVEPGMGYIIEGVPKGNNICRQCNREYVEGSTKECRYHAEEWGTIEVMKKERVKDVETGKWSYEKVLKEVPGWPCCEREELNAKGCAKNDRHLPTFAADGSRIKVKANKVSKGDTKKGSKAGSEKGSKKVSKEDTKKGSKAGSEKGSKASTKGGSKESSKPGKGKRKVSISDSDSDSDTDTESEISLSVSLPETTASETVTSMADPTTSESIETASTSAPETSTHESSTQESSSEVSRTISSVSHSDSS